MPVENGGGGMVRLRVAISRLRILLSVDPDITIFKGILININ